MNKSNMFTLSVVNETVWDLNKSIIIHKTTNDEVNVPLVNALHDSSMIITRRNDNDEVVHIGLMRLYPLLYQSINVRMKVVSLGSNLQNNGCKKFTKKLVVIVYQIIKVLVYVCLLP